MRPSWKLAVIGGEVTALAAFTGIGIHLAMQPHRAAFRPPPIVLPASLPQILPSVTTPLVPPTAVAKAPAPTNLPLGPALFSKFGEQDRNLLIQQWDILQRLTGALERYVEARLLDFEKRR
jgi:hypothetical protein